MFKYGSTSFDSISTTTPVTPTSPILISFSPIEKKNNRGKIKRGD